MDESSNSTSMPDPGLSALVMLLRLQGLGVDPAQIRHQFGAAPIGVPEMLRCAKGLGLKSRVVKTRWERLAKTPLPGIASLRGDDRAIVHEPNAPRPTITTRAELEAAWDGRLILMTRRAGLTSLTRRFDITGSWARFTNIAAC